MTHFNHYEHIDSIEKLAETIKHLNVQGCDVVDFSETLYFGSLGGTFMPAARYYLDVCEENRTDWENLRGFVEIPDDRLEYVLRKLAADEADCFTDGSFNDNHIIDVAALEAEANPAA